MCHQPFHNPNRMSGHNPVHMEFLKENEPNHQSGSGSHRQQIATGSIGDEHDSTDIIDNNNEMLMHQSHAVQSHHKSNHVLPTGNVTHLL